ncbi:hypothetical protein RA11412_0939 [Rothia aeria]|uniref:Uncharacterized protein n=2 Tax=Rothia aeria TaxID=172042 RepID=A0A2Z5QXQ9_9MICC|nr:hypothetical protein HMPREF1324_0687 [Rothia aeria F0474]BAV87238.1 hypothetical protein RA11412_0939 [Rothia aeria]
MPQGFTGPCVRGQVLMRLGRLVEALSTPLNLKTLAGK